MNFKADKIIINTVHTWVIKKLFCKLKNLIQFVVTKDRLMSTFSNINWNFEKSLVFSARIFCLQNSK